MTNKYLEKIAEWEMEKEAAALEDIPVDKSVLAGAGAGVLVPMYSELLGGILARRPGFFQPGLGLRSISRGVTGAAVGGLAAAILNKIKSKASDEEIEKMTEEEIRKAMLHKAMADTAVNLPLTLYAPVAGQAAAAAQESVTTPRLLERIRASRGVPADKARMAEDPTIAVAGPAGEAIGAMGGTLAALPAAIRYSSPKTALAGALLGAAGGGVLSRYSSMKDMASKRNV